MLCGILTTVCIIGMGSQPLSSGEFRGKAKAQTYGIQALSDDWRSGPPVSECNIDGVLYLTGALNPANDCQACLPSQSSTDWSPLPEGFSCGNPSATQCDNPDACDGAGDCETNHKPDGIGCNDASPCTENDACSAGICIGQLIPQVPAVTSLHSRALEVTVGPPGSSVEFALRLTSIDFGCLLKWISFDGTLSDSPHFQTADDWGTLYVTGTEIVPGADFQVAAECDGFLTAAGVDETPSWGDLDGNGAVDVDDILCMLESFSGFALGCTPESADMDPCEQPNEIIDVGDILAVLDAFIGAAYPCASPCSAP